MSSGDSHEDVSLTLLVLEAFYGGSHKHLLDIILKDVPSSSVRLITLPATKWHWRSRCGALFFAQNIPLKPHHIRTIFVSSSINLAELLGLRPDLSSCEKLLYFHENQLVYPRKFEKDRDYQHQHNEIVSALVADKILFNSNYNMRSFLENCDTVLNNVPETRISPIRKEIELKCSVLPVPLEFDCLPSFSGSCCSLKKGPLRIVWPHRWEHDKNPELFRDIVLDLSNRNCDFRLSILGESTQTVPAELNNIREKLPDKLIHFGFLEEKKEYFKVLAESDIVLSTSNHEFQGLSIIEAIHYDCYPLCPNKLVYPEYLPEKCRYNTSKQAVKFLAHACDNVTSFRKRELSIDLNMFNWTTLKNRYLSLLTGHSNYG